MGATFPRTLGNSATRDVGTAAGTVAAGDDGRFTAQNPPYRVLRDRGGQIAGSMATGTYVLLTDAQPQLATAGAAGRSVFYLDPADLAASGFTTNLRVAASLVMNATVPGATFTFGLYPVSATAGASGVLSITVDPVVSGSTAAFSPAPTANGRQVSSDFAAPAAGFYALGVVIGGSNVAAASLVDVRSVLSVHYS